LSLLQGLDFFFLLIFFQNGTGSFFRLIVNIKMGILDDMMMLEEDFFWILLK